jgi:uncharacterized protein (TIGR03437 family)
MRLLYSFVAAGLMWAAPPAYRIDTAAGSNLVADGGPAAAAPLKDAQSLAFDRFGSLWIADAGDHRIRQISALGIIGTAAGGGFAGYLGDNGPASASSLNLPYGVSADPAGNLYIADLGNNCVRRIATTGAITTVLAKLVSPRNVLADAFGNVYVSEFAGHRVRRINPDGTSIIVAGNGTAGSDGDGGPAGAARLSYPAGLALDRAGNLYIADSGNHKIRRITNGIITTVLGTGTAGAATASQLSTPTGVALDVAGNLYVADSANLRVRKLSPAGVVSTIAVAARDVAIAPDGTLFASYGQHVVRVLPNNAVANYAGDGSYFFRGDGGSAVTARLYSPTGVALDATGGLWIADTGNQRVRVVGPDGNIATVAGPQGLSGPATIAFDGSGSALIADGAGNVVKRLAGSTLTPAAGNGATGYTGEGYLAIYSPLSLPLAALYRPDGGFYIADSANQRIRLVTPQGAMNTVAGNGFAGFTGDGPAIGARVNSPAALALDASGALYFADMSNNRVRKLTPDGEIVTVAGGPQASLSLSQPRGVAVDSAGNVWIADTGNHRILLLAPDASVTVVAGTGAAGFAGDGGPALNAQFNAPIGITVDLAGGAVYVADSGNNRVRRLSPAPAGVTEAPPPSFTVVNAATLTAGPVAACSLVSIFGAGVGAADSQILFDGGAATIVTTGLNQVSVQVPCALEGLSSTHLEIRAPAGSLGKLNLALAHAAPGVFAQGGGTGSAVASNEDGSVNSTANPALSDSVVTLYATGIGQGDAVSVIIGPVAANVLFSGDAPGMIGMTQINVRIPSAAGGDRKILVLSGLVASQDGVNISIQ